MHLRYQRHFGTYRIKGDQHGKVTGNVNLRQALLLCPFQQKAEVKADQQEFWVVSMRKVCNGHVPLITCCLPLRN
jgi:hypothetical protein